MPIIKSLGHDCFTLSTREHSIVFDPWLTGNPDAVCKPEDLTVDAVLTSHGHGDHFGDTIAIAKRLDVPVIGVAELCGYCSRQGCQTAPMHLGGSHRYPWGRVKLTLALHGSGIAHGDHVEYVGPPCGFLVTMDGVTVYFAGDTGLFGDMKLIGDSVKVDAALLPIGDNYTMGPKDALLAAQMINPSVVIPMHYSAFPVIQQDAAAFAAQVEKLGLECRLLKPGDETEILAEA